MEQARKETQGTERQTMTLIDKAEALLPCPFCGAEQDDHGDLNDDAYFCKSSSGMLAIGCSRCMCIGAEGRTRAEAIAAWNRRAALPARKTEAHDDDLIRRGDVLRAADEELRRYGFTALEGRRFDMRDRLAAIPARGAGVKPLVWEPMKRNSAAWTATCPVSGHLYRAFSEEDKQEQDGRRIARILAALTTEAAHVNETPKSEHDAGNVLTDAAQARGATFLGVCDCGMTGPCMWDRCKHPLISEART